MVNSVDRQDISLGLQSDLEKTECPAHVLGKEGDRKGAEVFSTMYFIVESRARDRYGLGTRSKGATPV